MGKSKFFRRCGVGKGVEVLIRIPKETYNTCNFPEGGSGSPDLHLFMNSRESVEMIDTLKYTVVQLLQVDITTGV